MKRNHSYKRLLCAAALLLAFSLLCAAAPQEHSGAASSSKVEFGYKFENSRFYIPLIEVDVNIEGEGELRFKRGESDEVLDYKLKLLPATLARIRKLFSDSNFLDSDEDYQSSKDFSHLGWMTIWARDGERERKARFNFTSNAGIKELSEIFRAIATQAMHLFDLDLAGRYQPLDLPRLIEAIENDLRLGRIAEPEQMLAPLRDVQSNDALPLIARNHAGRIITAISKGKYQSPVKTGK